MHEIGVMQGRLLPQVQGRIQAFPWAHWRDEFELASRHGFQSIEFIFEADRSHENPVYTDEGVSEIAVALGHDPARFAATAGEDYELCVCAPAASADAAQAVPGSLTWIGFVVEGPADAVFIDADTELGGFEHAL